MTRFATILTACLFLLALPLGAGADTFQYGWTISASDMDPFINSGPPAGGLTSLYLWLTCVTKDGVASAEFALAVNGAGSSIIAFNAMNGFLNAGSTTELLLAAAGCPGDGSPAIPIVAGQILVLDFGAEYCIVNSMANDRNASVDCDQGNPQIHPNSTVGYTSAGGAPTCDDRTPQGLCPWISVDDTSWGQVKGLYR